MLTPGPCGELTAERAALLDWLIQEEFAGYDPYDGLESKLFQSLPICRSAFARLAWCQALKRLPIDLRPILGVPRLRNPKALGLVLTGLARLPPTHTHEQLGSQLVRWLREHADGESKGWGYPFAWQNRAFYAPANTPNAVCSAFVVNGLLDWGEATQSEEAIELALSSVPFFLDGVNRTTSSKGTCFSYTKDDFTVIHNVNLLVAAVLARIGRVKTSDALEQLAVTAVRHTIAHQQPDGSWYYGEAPAQRWIDGLHTGFNLVSLHCLETFFPSEELTVARRRGFSFFQDQLLDEAGLPKYYAHSRYPIDAHSCAQAIVTMLDSSDLDATALARATKIACWTKRVLGQGPGRYAYQRTRFNTRRIIYVRWCQAWMFRAFAELENALLQPPDRRVVL